MVKEMFESLVASHGEEVVGTALNRIREILVEKGELKHPTVIAEDAIQGHVSKFPLGVIQNEAHASLAEAWRLTHGNRKSSYGDVSVSFARYAKIWSGLLGNKLKEDLTASDVTLLMTALKLAREMNKQASDNVTDAHGYLILHDEIKAFEAESDEHA